MGVLMKFLGFVLSLGLVLASFNAEAGPRCTQRPYTNDQFCVGDIVGYRYNSAIGTVVDVFRGGYADVDWNISGSGYARYISVNDIYMRRPGGGGGGGDYDRPVYDARGSRLYVGAVVHYNYNEAIGTVDRVNGYSQTIDVRWNIRGSGYGRNLPARDVTMRR